jgi:hypothetical protein
MDPLVELIQRLDTRHPYDHSLDGFPLTPVVVAFLGILGVALALGLTGRSWKLWYLPAMAVWFTWNAGIQVGRYGFWSLYGLIVMAGSVLVLFEPTRRTLRAALGPAKGG